MTVVFFVNYLLTRVICLPCLRPASWIQVSVFFPPLFPNASFFGVYLVSFPWKAEENSLREAVFLFPNLINEILFIY